MDNTTHLLLNKPTDADTFDQSPFNANSDIIERWLGLKGFFKTSESPYNLATGVITPYDIGVAAKLDDYENWLDTTTNRYTPQRAGWYLFHMFASSNVAFPSTTSIMEIVTRKNGAAGNCRVRIPHNNAGDGLIINGMGLLKMNGTTDYVDWTLNQDSGSSVAFAIELAGFLLIPT